MSKIVYFVNTSAFFVSHRLNLALKAKNLGYEVKVIFGQNGSNVMDKESLKILKENNIGFYKTKSLPSGKNFLMEIYGFFQSLIYLLKEKPDILHCASPKACVLGGLVAKIIGIKCLVLAITGFGYLFTEDDKKRFSLKKLLIKNFFCSLLYFVCKRKNIRAIVQNNDDLNELKNLTNIKKEDIVLIKGSGVNVNRFNNLSFSDKRNIVLFPGKVTYHKGIKEFFYASKHLAKEFQNWKFAVAGEEDYDSRSNVPKKTLLGWKKEGVVEFLGYRKDINELFLKSSIVCLPSKREGMPKALLEAASAGCAVITSDAVGTREAIINFETGLLVPVGNTKKLVDAIRTLIINKNKRIGYGKNGQILAKKEFDIEKVTSKHMEIYESLLTSAVG